MPPRQDSPITGLDRAHLIHPWAEFRVHEANDPEVFVGGKGIRVQTAAGRSLIDGVSGLANINVGHGRSEIAAAVAEQMRRLAYYPAFGNFSSEPAPRLAARLADLIPADREIDRFLFTSGGSDANEMAFRLARLYHGVQGATGRRKILSRSWSYHGITRGAGSATRLAAYHAFEDPDPLHVQTAAPYCFRCELGRSYPDCALACAEDVEAVIQREGPETVAALIAEPVMGTGGMIVPPPDYFARLQEVCRAHGVLLILDEVITGFGRTGKWFGMEQWDVVPDLVTFAKGLTSGYQPLGAVGLSRPIYETIRDRSPEGLPFMGGITYNNHPTGCAAALANLEILEREGLVENAAEMGAHLLRCLRDELGGHPLVSEIRGLGLMLALELTEPGTTDPVGGRPEALPHAVADRCFERGLIVRSLWECVGLAPPLCVTRSEADEILDLFLGGFREAAESFV